MSLYEVTTELHRSMLDAAQEIPDGGDLRRFGRDEAWGLSSGR
jgi:hypothetical protein